MNMLELEDSHMVFEMSTDVLDIEVRVNCEVDENHIDGMEFDTIMLDCPAMVTSELNAQRFERDFKILGLMAVKKYEVMYARNEQQTENGYLDD